MVSINVLNKVNKWLPLDRQQLQGAQETDSAEKGDGQANDRHTATWIQVSGDGPETKVYWSQRKKTWS